MHNGFSMKYWNSMTTFLDMTVDTLFLNMSTLRRRTDRPIRRNYSILKNCSFSIFGLILEIPFALVRYNDTQFQMLVKFMTKWKNFSCNGFCHSGPHWKWSLRWCNYPAHEEERTLNLWCFEAILYPGSVLARIHSIHFCLRKFFSLLIRVAF